MILCICLSVSLLLGAVVYPVTLTSLTELRRVVGFSVCSVFQLVVRMKTFNLLTGQTRKRSQVVYFLEAQFHCM